MEKHYDRPIFSASYKGPGQADTGRIPQGNYLWDFRQANVTVKGVKMVDWFIEKYMFSDLDGLGNPLISGFYIGRCCITQTKVSKTKTHTHATLGIDAALAETAAILLAAAEQRRRLGRWQ